LPTQSYFGGTDGTESLYGPQEVYRSYAPQQQSTISSHPVFVEHEPATAYTHGQLPYLSTSIVRTPITTENLSSFGMTSLHSSLPQQLADRQLPAPTGKRVQPATSASSTGALRMRSITHGQSAASNNVNVSLSYNGAALRWPPGTAPLEGRNSGANNSPSTDRMPPPLSKGSLSSASTSEASVLSYATSPEEGTHAVAAAVSFTSPGTRGRSTPSSNGQYSIGHSLPIEKDASLPRQDSSSNLCSFGADSTNNSKRTSFSDVPISEGSTLVSGQRYTPLSQPQPQHPASVEALGRMTFDGRLPSTHRNSAASLSAQSF